MSPRFIKVFRDLTTDKVKSIMLTLAIAIGVFGLGTILGAYAVLTREMARNYMGTQPASATIKVEDGCIDQNLLEGVRKMPGILQAERHATVLSRMKIGNDWYPMLLFVIDDFRDIKTNRITKVSGAWPPPAGTMLVERTALTVMKSGEGKEVVVKTPHGEQKAVPISGIVHDPGLAPAWQEQTGYGYITLSTLQWLGEQQGFDELRVRMADAGNSVGAIEEKSKAVADWIEGRGHFVHEVQVPPPGRHPHQGQMNAILSLFTAFSFMTLILSAILVTSSISTLMTKQIREIGIMKTIGADSFQISGLYLLMVFAFSVLAVVTAVPLSQFLAKIFVYKMAKILNLTVFDASIPFWVFVMQVLSGILIPLSAAAVPVLRGGRITVREALDNYGVTKNSFGKGRLETILARLNVFGETFTLSLRNVFRQRSRLVMTLGLLAAGGAMFMTALNVSKAWDVNLQKIYKQRLYDLEVRLSRPVYTDEIMAKIRQIPGIKEVEAWGYSPTSFIKDAHYEISHTYPDKGHGSFSIVALPPHTKLVKLPVLEGRWLKTDNANEVVINRMALSQSPNLKVGDVVSLSLDGHPFECKIVGVAEDIFSPSTAYVSADTYTKLSDTKGLSNMLSISMNSRDRETVLPMVRKINELIEKEKAPVSATIPMFLIRNAVSEHMGVLVGTLLVMAFLMAAVGMIGLMSTMSTNVLERTRELGVMRAIGATPKRVILLVVTEGLIIGVFSLVFAFAGSLALSAPLGKLIGNMAFRTPLPLAISLLAFFVWVVIIVIGSVAATLYPAWRAGRMTTHEALSYY